MQYSVRSRRAVARLYSQYNDIDIYVEDKTYVGVYEKLINRVLDGHASVQKVIPLGPKSEVIKRASLDLNTNGRPRLYIVDGDVDLIAYARQSSYPHLFRLNVYSLENLLMEEGAIRKYCSFASPASTEGICEGKVRPDKLLEELDDLISYMVVIAIAKRLKIRDALFALNAPSVTKTVSGKHIAPHSAKIYSRKRAMVRKIISLRGIAPFKEAKRIIKQNIRSRKIEDHRIVPGKLFPLMYLNERVAAAGGVSLPQKAVVSYLSEHVTLKHDKKLVARLKKLGRAA